MRTLYLDLETYSETPITHGTWAYAENAEILLLAYAWDDDEVQVVEFPAPGMMQSLIDAADQIVIHNSHFDRTVLSFSQVRVPVDRIYDTLAVGLLHSLPGALDKQCEVLGVPLDKAKDKAGKKLIQLFCRPQAKTRKIRRATKETHPAEWEAFKDYARMDIVAMREVYKRQPKVNWTDAEKAVWRLDQAINDRGIQIDMDLAHAALRAAKEAGQRLATESALMTNGAVPSATRRDAMIGYLRDTMGLEIDDLRKGTLGALLKTDVPDDVRELLEVRLQAAATSPAKYRVLVNGTSSDGRLRGTMQYAGASRTARFGGRLFQPQNLPRPTLKQPQIELGIEAMKAGVETVFYDDVMELCASAVRGSIVAAPGCKLVVADLSNIEGRVLAWLAGEQWKMDAFRAFDTVIGYDHKGKAIRKGPDIYKSTAAGILGKTPEEVTDDERQVNGKVPELACGFQGSIGAFAAMGAALGVSLPEPKVLEIVKAWRAKHKATVKFWYDCERAARNAISNPGEVYRASSIAFRRSGGWLRARLPSGRYLCYPSPEVDEDGRLSYMGTNQYTRRWERLDTYGGKLCIAEGTPVLTDAGWVPIEHVTAAHQVWDGVEWVQHAGLAKQGFKEVIQAHGVYMTPDHEILTTEGWVRASQSQGLERAACRLPDGYPVFPERRQALAVGGGVRLRRRDRDGGVGTGEAIQARDLCVVRVQAGGYDTPQEHPARHVKASGLCGLAVDARQVPAVDASGVAELRCPGHIRVREVAALRELLGRHGADLQNGTDTRPDRQQRELRADQLPLGSSQAAGPEQAEQHLAGHAVGPYDSGRGGGALGVEPHNAAVSDVARRGTGAHVLRAGRFAQVFDLVNCGPRRRFVVASEDGGPLIVHNCENLTQATARDVLVAGLLAAEAAGYNPVLHVHDEIICETPDDPSFSAEGLAALMSQGTQWSVGLPLAAAGFETYRYQKGD